MAGLPSLLRRSLSVLRRRLGASAPGLRLHALRARSGHRSHAGEAEHLERLLGLAGIDGGCIVDLAAGDGVTLSPTLPLFRRPGWGGLAIELDPVAYRRLAFAYRQFAGVRTVRRKATPDTIEEILASERVPDSFEVLNLDIDSYDLAVADALLRSFRPGVITMEINEKVPPPVYFEVLYDPDHTWAGDHYYGCSLVAAAEVVKPRGYRLESLQYNNAFFVRDDLAPASVQDLSAARAYDAGYRFREDRKALFPYNADVDDLLELPPHEVVARLRERFAPYAGGFRLEVRAGEG